jgi:hypothetical protein
MAVDPLSLDFGREKRFCVYVYFDPRPRKKREPIYVGKGLTSRRPDAHWLYPARIKNTMFQGVLAKIKRAGLAPIVEIVQYFDTEDAAFACEIALIGKFGRRSLGTGSLCNLTPGGGGNAADAKRSELTRLHLRESHLGKKQTPEQRARASETLRKRWQDAEQRKKLSSHPGHSPDTKRKMSDAAIRRWGGVRPVY